MQDADVLRRVHQHLHNTGYNDLKNIRYSIEDDDETDDTADSMPRRLLVLRGTVCSFFMKQMAQVCIRDGIGNFEIRNLIEVTVRNS